MNHRRITCANCGLESEHKALGYCAACYQYQYRTGRARPLSYPTRCLVCDDPLTRWRHGRLCPACSMRAWRRGLRAADVYAGGPGVLLRTRRTPRPA